MQNENVNKCNLYNPIKNQLSANALCESIPNETSQRSFYQNSQLSDKANDDKTNDVTDLYLFIT